MNWQVGKQYKTVDGDIVECVSYEPKTPWFPVKVKTADSTFYTVTEDGKRLWNALSTEDISCEVN